MKKEAFTLAEVLITLGIIGVVAALTIPTLIQNYKKREIETSLQKIYSTVNQAIKKAELDYGEYENWEFTSDGSNALDQYFIPYLNVSKIEPSTHTNNCTGRRMYLADGSLLIGSACNFFGYWIDFCYYPKAKNWKGNSGNGCFESDGSKSAFWFTFSTSKNNPGKIPFLNSPFIPYIGSDVKEKLTSESLTNPKYTYACNKESSTPRQCTALIMLNNWKIPDDYPFRLK